MALDWYVVLLHSPVQNRRGDQVTSSVTNLDIHDIARTACTYGARAYYIVTPIEDQHQLVGRILGHWRTHKSEVFHPDRVRALSKVRLAYDFAQVKREIEAEVGQAPEVVLTDAREYPGRLTYAEYRKELERKASEVGTQKPVIVLLGTAWGVHESFFPEVHRILAPVYGPEGNAEGAYNHLSVRAAAGVILDRLFGH